MRKIIACVMPALVAVAAFAGAAGAREPSEACQNGEIAPATTPAGIGVRQAGDPYQEPTSVYVCSRVVAPGAVWLRADNLNGRAHVIVDGDTTNRATPCSDGYAAVRIDQDGSVRTYRGDDGDFTFIARERTLGDWLSGVLACVMPDLR